MAESILPKMAACYVMMARHTSPLLRVPYQLQLKKKEIRAKFAMHQYVAKMRKRTLPQTDEFYASIKKHDGLPCIVEPIRYNAERQYRNKSSCSVGYDAEGNISVGHTFRYRHSANNIDQTLTISINGLQTTKKIHADIFTHYHDFLKETRVPPCGSNKPWGEIIVRSNEKDECMVQIQFNPEEATNDQSEMAKAELLHKLLPTLQSSVKLKSFFWLPVQYNKHTDIDCEKLWGDSHIEETLLGKRFLISPQSFFQVNTAAAEILYQATIEQLRTNKNTILLDVCCGTGTIGIIMSDFVSKVIGVDNCKSALADAKLNAQLNSAHNVEHVCSDAEEFLADIVQNGTLNGYEHVVAVVNPHRTGLTTKLIRKLRQVLPLKQVVYLSCLPEGRPTFNFMQLSTTSTTRRLGKPFQLKNVVPIDPFPYTRYVELVLNFER